MSALPNYSGPLGHHPEHTNNEPAELAGSDIPAELSGDAPPQSSSHPAGAISPQSHDPIARQDFFPPPPPGPPPKISSPSATGHAEHQHHQQQRRQQQQQGAQEYFPPPPPGPPPNQQHQYQAYVPADQKLPPPPSPLSPGDYDAPPPSYAEEFGDGPPPAHVAGGHAQVDPDAKTGLPLPPPPGPPKLPPRPVSASSAAGMYFPPPPTSASQAHGPGEGVAAVHHGAAAGTGGGTGGGGGSDYGSGGFGEKLYRWGVKAGVPVNKIAHKFGSEAFWPMTMDLECDKAARILKGFCKDGFYTTKQKHPDLAQQQQNQTQTSHPKPPSSPLLTPSQPSRPNRSRSPSPNNKTTSQQPQSKVLVKIPPSVIANAKGLAIFTTFRTGLHISGAGGSGVVVARLPDGSWSPPAGFLVHTLGAGLMVGIDVYDCVCVLTTQAAVDAFARRARVSLGGEIAVVAGPVGVGGVLEGLVGGPKTGGGNGSGHDKKGSRAAENAVTHTNASNNGPTTTTTTTTTTTPTTVAAPTTTTGCENKPVWSYMKSRGFYAGVQADGTVIIPRADANAAFYGERGISVEKILKGQVPVRSGGHQANLGKGKDEGLVMWPDGGRLLVEVLKAADGKGADKDVLRGLGNVPTPGDMAPHMVEGEGEDGKKGVYA